MGAIGLLLVLAFAFLTPGLTAPMSKEWVEPGSVISANIQVKVCVKVCEVSKRMQSVYKNAHVFQTVERKREELHQTGEIKY